MTFSSFAHMGRVINRGVNLSMISGLFLNFIDFFHCVCPQYFMYIGRVMLLINSSEILEAFLNSIFVVKSAFFGFWVKILEIKCVEFSEI